MRLPRALAVVCVVAALHGVFFIWYQRPDWYTDTAWDQDGYRRLGEALATTGRFTRFPNAAEFVPEVLRTPMYPIFLALVYRLFGTGQMPVALAQTGLFMLICVAVFFLARRVASVDMALAAAAVTALFSPIPYFGALVMTEVWTTLLFTASMTVMVASMRRPTVGPFAWLGLLLALTTLSRPVFVFFPIALAAIGVVLFPALRIQPRPALRHWASMLGVFALSMLPWLTYNYVTLGRFTLSPAGGVGRGLWEGSWQAKWSGRLQNELTHLADDVDDRAELDRRVAAIAEREHLPPGEMLRYVHQWEDIRRIWDEPVDPHERAVARVRADQEYQRVALENLRRDPPAHLIKRLARGVFILWAGEIPFRYSDINTLPPAVIRVCWAIQTVIGALALVGLVALARAHRLAEAAMLAAPLVYITAVHLPLLTEARQSLPSQPVLLLLATLGAASLLGRSFALKAQVHEGQHL